MEYRAKFTGKLKCDIVPVSILIIITALVFYCNYRVPGPMIQADEGSYLANAAAIAGYSNDLASSYSAGYSILISPAFLPGGEPSRVWLRVKVINSFLYILLSFGLWRLSCTKLLDGGKRNRFISTVIVTAYPMWVVMVGYAFSQLAFACAFIWSVYFLQKFIERESRWYLIVFSLMTGYLYCIHPTGIAVVAAGCLVTFGYSIRRSDGFRALSFYIAVCALVIFLYVQGFQPWLLDRMTIGGDPKLHYPSITKLLMPLLSIEGLQEVVGRLAGHIFYLVIGTLGLFWIGFRTSVIKFAAIFKPTEEQRAGSAAGLIHAFLLLCVAGVLCLSVLLFSSTAEANRLDHWMYGRYVEGVIAPLLLIGSFHFSRKGVVQSAIVAIVAATLLHLTMGDYGHTARFNIPTFWQDFYVRDQGLIYWLAYGLLLTFLVAVCGKMTGRILILGFFAFCSYLQISWHEKASVAVSGKWEAANYVRENVTRGTCIGFDHSGIDSYSRHVFWFDFSFQLYDYKLQRVSAMQWAKNECYGPLFTYNKEIDSELGIDARVVAISPQGGPLLWKRGRYGTDIYPISVVDRSQVLASTLVDGWHSVEKKHVWSTADALLTLPVPEQCKNSSCYANIEFSIFGASRERPATIVLFSADTDEPEHRGIYTSNGPFDVSIKLNPYLSRNRVSIVAPNAVSPKELIGSPDDRVLGIALHSIALREK